MWRATNGVIDPGDAGEINVTKDFTYVPLVSAGSETRTLNDPTRVGKHVILAMETDAGDIVLTTSTAYDNGGGTTITFNDTGDYVEFVSIKKGSDIVWRIVGYDGVIGPAVGAGALNMEIVTTTNVLTAAESGKTFVLNSGTAFVTTLPAVDEGLNFKFYCGATGPTGGNHTIVPHGDNDNTIFGQCMVAGAVVAAADEGSINLIADKFIPGDWIEVFCDGTDWYVSGQVVTAAGCTFTT